MVGSDAAPFRGLFVSSAEVNLSCVENESVALSPSPPRSKLTGGQKWTIAGLLFLQIPSSLIFFPLAAIFAITGIFVPIAVVLMGIGSLPISFAMKCKDRWQGGGVGLSTVVPT
jgi:hypothetical protein